MIYQTQIRQSRDPYKLDAQESAFFKRELEYVKSRTYDTKYKQLKSFILLPISTEADPGAEQITYKSFTGVGYAKIVSDYANDFPRVDVFGVENHSKIKSIGASYGYSIQEIRRSMMVGRSLDQRRANISRRAVEEKMDNIAWNGDTTYNIPGFINFPGITEYVVPAGVGGTTWALKTPDEIVADLNGIVTAVISPTNGMEAPDTMIMPIDQYTLISTTRMTGSSDTTILKFFLENNQHITNVEWLTELKAAGASAKDRFMVYPRDPNNVTFEIPQPYEAFSPQQTNMEFQIPCHARTGGVLVYYPLSIAFGDGI